MVKLKSVARCRKESPAEALNFFGEPERTDSTAGKRMIAGMKRAGLKKRSKKGRKAVSEKLRTAAEVLLRREGKSVIEGLAENCRDGQVQSAKLLYEIAHGAEEGNEGFGSLAFRLNRE